MKKSCLLLALLSLFVIACGDDDTPKAPNLALASLTVSSGMLTPALDPAITAYTVSVSNAVDAITVAGVAADTNATVVVDPESPSTLKTGANLVMVWVFSADGTAFKVYRVTVIRTVGTSTNADLSYLSISAGDLVPAFNPAVFEYRISEYVSNTIASTFVTALASESGASISYQPGQASSLSAGSNCITVRVTAEDGTTSKDYTIRVYRMGVDYTSPTIGNLKYVPSGAFQRDATNDNVSFVSAFRMSRTEITRSQYSTVMGADPSEEAYSSGTSDPVLYINWYRAIAFCNKLSIAEGFEPVYIVTGVDFSNLVHASIPTTSNDAWNAATANWAANGYRLPTEMEWMWAAMGANMGADPFAINTTGHAKAFAGGNGSNIIGDYAWYIENNPSHRTHPVGSKLPNKLGLYDMSGNVNEWCWDFRGDYPAGYLADYQGAASGYSHIRRGGGWDQLAYFCTVAYRIAYGPWVDSRNSGFRVVRP